MQHEITSSILIAASPERLWGVLLDFARYPEWNPFVRSIHGQPTEGSTIKVTIQSHKGKAIMFEPIVLRNSPSQEFRWKGRFLLPGVFDGEHYFHLAARGAGATEFTHGERFTGLLVPLLRGMLERDTRAGFEAMNLALKRRVEGSGT